MLVQFKTKRQPKPSLNADGNPLRRNARQLRRPLRGQDFREGGAPNSGLNGAHLQEATTARAAKFANFAAPSEAAKPKRYLRPVMARLTAIAMNLLNLQRQREHLILSQYAGCSWGDETERRINAEIAKGN